MEVTKDDFGPGFHFGVSAAAFQTEGAVGSHGKGPSVWDQFTHRNGKIRNGDTADIACDFYHRFPQDLALMASMNIPNFRFSLSWPRIFPKGAGEVNKAGIDHYNRVIDLCLELGIEPWITIYHWDLPHELEVKGGWANRGMLNWFADYVSTCIQAFGDRVKHWMILNEPVVFCGAGYFLGVHAPGRKEPEAFFAAVHHAALCQALGGSIIRSFSSDIKVGTTFSCTHIESNSDNAADTAAALRTDTLLNRVFIEPLLGLGYPVRDLKLLQRLEPYVRSGDESRLQFDMDFIGIQNYTREVIAHSWLVPYLQARIVKADQRQVARTQMNWEVYPEAIYKTLLRFGAYENIPALIVTENGAAFQDEVSDNAVIDHQRTLYLQDHIAQVLRAKRHGVNVNGYFVWTFTDNFEWAEGYHPRFGIVHVNFKTQKRIVKASGHWYKRFLGGAAGVTSLTHTSSHGFM